VQQRDWQVAAVSVRQAADIPAGAVNPITAGCGHRVCRTNETAASLAAAAMLCCLRRTCVTSESLMDRMFGRTPKYAAYNNRRANTAR
jgi:hypothetical protein